MHSLRLALRELGRRRLRSALTIVGIAIGVSALLLLGGLAERLIHLVAGGRAFASGQISVSGAGAGTLSGMTRGALVTGEQLGQLATVPGVTAVAPIVMFPLGDAPATVPFGLPTLVFGVDMAALFFEGSSHRVPPPPVQSGRLMPAPNSDEVVLGSQAAGRFGATPGSRITIRGREFVVVGVLGPTLTGPDSFVFMPFGTAEQLLLDTEPVLRKLALVPGAGVLPIATAAAVFWGTDVPDVVADRIRAAIPQLTVVSPNEAARQIDRALGALTGLIVGAAFAALLVAALAVANTMFTAVLERRRHIGLLRAVGATRGQLMGQLATEAALLGVLGSALGLLAGGTAIAALNRLTADTGGASFVLTPRLLGVAILLPPAMAVASSWWPARRAALLAPTEALRFV